MCSLCFSVCGSFHWEVEKGNGSILTFGTISHFIYTHYGHVGTFLWQRKRQSPSGEHLLVSLSPTSHSACSVKKPS